MCGSKKQEFSMYEKIKKYMRTIQKQELGMCKKVGNTCE